MPKKCSMLECNSNYDSVLRTQPPVSVYKIPTDPVRREKWLKLIPRKNWNITTSSVVCIKHFKEKFLERYELGKDGQQIVYKTPRLKRNARPTLFGEDLVEVQHSETEDESDQETVDQQSMTIRKPPQEFPKIVNPTPAPDEPEPANKIKINNTCRVCMQSCKGMQSIYMKRKNYLVVALIANLSGVPIYRNDGLPDEICDTCFARVYEANETRKMCEDSDKKLKTLLGQLQAMDLKDVISTAEAKAQARKVQEGKPEFVNVDSPLIKKKKEAQKNTELDLNTAREMVESMDASQNAGRADENDDDREENDANNNGEEEEYTGPIQFACCMCVNLFENEDELLAHAKTHDIPVREYLPGKTVECRLCLKRFTKAKNYNNHIKGLYEEKKVCPLCGLRVPGNTYQEHMADHSDPDAQAQLDLIGKERRERKDKIDKRRGPKKKCPECDREFTLNTHLNIHIKAVHLKEKPYKCDECGSAFAYKDSLVKHSLKHSNERKFTCHLCPKTYIYRADLRVHLQRHQNIRNYSCNLCELKFFSKKHLKQHMVTHNPDSIWKCNLCDKSYRQQYTLTKHKFAEHKIPIQKRGSNLFGRGYHGVEPMPKQYEEVMVEEGEGEEEHLMEEETIEEGEPDYIVQETHFDGEYETVPVVDIPID